MSSTEEIEAKAGHPPAMKVGGVRIPQRRSGVDEKEGLTQKPHKDSESEKEEEEIIVVKSAPKAQVVVSGVVGRVDRDFPTAAVKHTHDKPVPTHESRPLSSSKPTIIQQPKK